MRQRTLLPLEQFHRFLRQGAGPLINTVKLPSPGGRPEPIGITGAELISSYNWMGRDVHRPGQTPTIMVPGGPPVVRSNVPLPMQLQRDGLPLDIDPNLNRLPITSRLLPLFQALELTRPNCRFDDVDIITNRGDLMLLLSFCARSDRGSFRVEASVVQDSLVLDFWSKTPTRVYEDDAETRGYGPEFEQAMTSYPRGLEDSHSHWRVLRYKLGPLTCVVRYEADATTTSYGDFSARPGTIRHAPNNRSATVIVGGRMTPQGHGVEIKTGPPSYPLRYMYQWIPKFWMGCTKHLVLGGQRHGLFNQVVMGNMEKRIDDWIRSAETQDAVARLVRLIPALKQAVQATSHGQAVLIFRQEPEDEVEVYDAGERIPLVSHAMARRFWDSAR
ncbi:hypothetical protein PG989_004355 [Apiospora arundinis]